MSGEASESVGVQPPTEPPASAPFPNASTHVFISYASQDVAAAAALCAALEAAALPCWIAPRDVRAGESYAAAIVQAINSCQLVVLVLSKSAIDSSHVLREVERASSKNRPVLSVHLDAIELTPELEYFLSAHQWLDASGGPIERIFPALIESVRGRAAGKISRSDGQAPNVGGIPRTPASGADAPTSHASSQSHRLPLQIPFLEQLSTEMSGGLRSSTSWSAISFWNRSGCLCTCWRYPNGSDARWCC